ncbi:type VII secretion target [Nocardioides albus]|uniref:Uncharacterized protein YukE n=1 Tax=Nocardioides albus TaxID=1841 RepID=A0A7W5A698_9ACTN|nr:type VII secretion target [Nocardioides albus]MBB3090482.1 uncharacterized protein YukE [Nocardioides albus]
MTDPEVRYRSLVSGDSGSIGGIVGDLEMASRDVADVADQAAETIDVPVWSSMANAMFRMRASALVTGLDLNHDAVVRARGALDSAMRSYDDMVGKADLIIGIWRSRPRAPIPLVDEMMARVIDSTLMTLGTSYNSALANATAFLTGDEVDLDKLDEDARGWVEKGLDRSRNWYDESGSYRGPLIPNTMATGDERGWVPQGLGYDDENGILLQSYYDSDDENGDGKLSLIDETSGTEISNVTLEGASGHVGGVTVDGDTVYVSSGGQLHQYSMSDLRKAKQGESVPPSGPPADVEASSYTAVHGNSLFVGSFDGSKMYRYQKVDGQWDFDNPVETINTPPDVQGVVVRDGEYVFSTSWGRDKPSSLIVQNRDDETDRSDPYPYPNMAEGIVEVDGEIITTYESGSGAYRDPGSRSFAEWLRGEHPDADLWSSPYMTRTPLSELGLEPDGAGGDIEVQPETLRKAAATYAASAGRLRRIAGGVESVGVQSAWFGEVPAAEMLAQSITKVLSRAASSLDAGRDAMERLGDALDEAAVTYQRTDDETAGRGKRLEGRL